MIAERLAEVRMRITRAAREAGRDPASVQLVAVSKTFPVDVVQAAIDAGQVDLGENYAQELAQKATSVSGSVRWHFLGRLQSNKVKLIVPHAHRIHALCEVHHAEALMQRAPEGVDALIHVDIGREASKGGVVAEDLLDRVRAISAVRGLRVRGLMCLPPVVEDPEDAAPFFAETADLLARCRADGFAMDELSMGMSHDFEVAVRHGATWVRVGTAIFGRR